MDFLRPRYTKAFTTAAFFVSVTHKFSRITHVLISLHWLTIKKNHFFLNLPLQVQNEENIHSPNCSTNKLPPLKGLRFPTHSHSFKELSNHTYTNSALPHETLFLPNLPFFFPFFFCKALKSFFLLWPPFMGLSSSSHTSITSLLCFCEALKTFLFEQFVAERS